MDNEGVGSWSRPQTIAELVVRIREERAALEAVIRPLRESELVRPGVEGWSIKDHLAHIAVWERVLVGKHLEGRTFAEAAGMDPATAAATIEMTAETGLNEWFYRRDRHRPLAEVLTEFEAAHREVLRAVGELRDAALTASSDHDQGYAPTLLQAIIGDTYAHYQEHRWIIERLLAKGGH
ncbi:MAG: ClbS/DfsB family four-helix bundle protein [Chloroflexota bacterium]|nr:ClbS/DfsB family four-helix bundle protein [Chloroflexota bacterium]